MAYMNVLETYPLFDTVGVCADLPNFSTRPAGWFGTFAAMGNAIDIPFFNQRNVASAGAEYTNLETRDQTPWPFQIHKINIAFFSPSIASQFVFGPQNVIEYKHSPLWEMELPRHFGVELAVNTDVRFNCNALMPGSGGGPVGGGYGMLPGAPSGPDLAAPTCYATTTQGIADRRNGWTVPEKLAIDVPWKAAISVTLKPSEYARRLLQAISGPHLLQFANAAQSDRTTPGAFFGIRVTLHGIRGVQQRGEAHA